MIYSLSLETALLLVGLVLIVAHVLALLNREKVQAGLRAFPRSQIWGTVLIVIATAWAWWLIKTIDLGEFTNWRGRLLVMIPIMGFLTWRYITDFLSVRALGMVALLAAEPLLESAWMRPEMSRLLLVTLVYVWITLALFWIGMPYTLRDQISWVTKTAGRWSNAAVFGIVYGVALVISRLTLHR